MSHGHAGITCKVDIYALGCLLVEMCTGEPLDTGVLTLKVFVREGDSAESALVHIMQRCLSGNTDGTPRATALKVQQVGAAYQ